jgi:hypothetical protein
MGSLLSTLAGAAATVVLVLRNVFAMADDLLRRSRPPLMRTINRSRLAFYGLVIAMCVSVLYGAWHL